VKAGIHPAAGRTTFARVTVLRLFTSSSKWVKKVSLLFNHGSQPEIKRFTHLATHSLIKFLMKPAYFKYACSLALN